MGNSKENAMRPVAIHRVYTEAGGQAANGPFRLGTPAALAIQDCTLVSACGAHKAKFTPTDKLAQKDCAIRITHGAHRGLNGNLDATAKVVSGNPKSSGWLFWRIVDAPQWFIDSLAQKVADRESGKADADVEKAAKKAKREEAQNRLDPDLPKFSPGAAKAKAQRLAKVAQGAKAAAMGGLES